MPTRPPRHPLATNKPCSCARTSLRAQTPPPPSTRQILTPPDQRPLYTEALFLAASALPFSLHAGDPPHRRPPWARAAAAGGGGVARVVDVQRKFFGLAEGRFLFASFVPPAAIEPTLCVPFRGAPHEPLRSFRF